MSAAPGGLCPPGLAALALPRLAALADRTLPGGAATGGQEPLNALNLIFIVGFCVLITVLARWLSGRGRRK